MIHACIAVHGCEEVTTWGVTDAQTWLDGSSPWLKPTRPLLFDTSFQPKPAYFAVRNAIAANARDVLAAPNREVAVTWSAADDARLVEIAMHLGVTPEQVQKIAVYFLALLVSYLPPGQLPVTIQPSGTHTTRLNSWSAAETGVLDAVSTKFVLDDSTATRLSAHVLSFLFALGGN